MAGTVDRYSLSVDVDADARRALQYAALLVLWEHESVTLGFLCAELQLDTGSLWYLQ